MKKMLMLFTVVLLICQFTLTVCATSPNECSHETTEVKWHEEVNVVCVGKMGLCCIQEYTGDVFCTECNCNVDTVKMEVEQTRHSNGDNSVCDICEFYFPNPGFIALGIAIGLTIAECVIRISRIS